MNKLFEFVWFWHPAEWALYGPHRFIGRYRDDYRWVVTLGPLEIRRWAR